MSFNGSGVFVRLYSWASDAAANIKIRADRMDNEFNGMATGLSTCITKDGQTTPTANLPMGGYKHQNIAIAAARNEYSSLGQVQDGNINWVDGGGTADAITASYTTPITALVDGQICWVRATAANATTTPTFSPDALTARTIVKNGGAALVAGEISGDGHQLILRYDLANTRWELLNPKTLLTATSTATLQNKTLDNTNTVTLKDTLFTLQDDGDATKQFRTQVSGVTAGQTRVMTVPDTDFTPATTVTAQVITNKDLTSATNTFPVGMVPVSLGVVATTSGTEAAWTTVPATANRLILNFSGVSTNGVVLIKTQLGSGSYSTSGYLTNALTALVGSMAVNNLTDGFNFRYGAANVAASAVTGTLELYRVGTTHEWIGSLTGQVDSGTQMFIVTGKITLGGALDRVRIFAGGDTFDAGSAELKWSV